MPPPPTSGSPLPGLQPDLAFLWRAMEWAARDGGQIALAMSGKLLHQQTEGMPQARADLWESLDVTGVVSGAKLAGTKVWPGMVADFCLVFATNSRPSARSATLVLCPSPSMTSTGAVVYA
ncbi:MAG: hypothetical protein IPI35_26135 [Deltaproteobacteria bacterium]|nr:hypothetical protein [Deltaproteobacteria bacterium]